MFTVNKAVDKNGDESSDSIFCSSVPPLALSSTLIIMGLSCDYIVDGEDECRHNPKFLLMNGACIYHACLACDMASAFQVSGISL